MPSCRTELEEILDQALSQRVVRKMRLADKVNSEARTVAKRPRKAHSSSVGNALSTATKGTFQKGHLSYRLAVFDQIVEVVVTSAKDDEGITRARMNSDLPAANNAEYLSTVLQKCLAGQTLENAIVDHNRDNSHDHVSSVSELAQAIVNRAVSSYRRQHNVD